MVPPFCPLVAGGCGPVRTTCTTSAPSSRTTIGRVCESLTRPTVLLDQVPATGSKTRSKTSGVAEEVLLVLTAAKTRPVPSRTVLRLMWSSARRGPDNAVFDVSQVVSGSPSVWIAQRIVESTWLLHMMPMRPGPEAGLNATTDEMSSASTVVPGPGRMYGVTHV